MNNALLLIVSIFILTVFIFRKRKEDVYMGPVTIKTKMHSTEQPFVPVDQSGISCDTNHLPVNADNVRAILSNPNVTYEDCDALYFSLCNSPSFGGCHPLVDEVLLAQGDIAHREFIAKG